MIWNLRFGRRPRFVSLKAEALADLRWWSERGVIARPVPFVSRKPDVVVFTDASRESWGAASDDWTVHGRWS